jgi:hypothetical protein
MIEIVVNGTSVSARGMIPGQVVLLNLNGTCYRITRYGTDAIVCKEESNEVSKLA